MCNGHSKHTREPISARDFTTDYRGKLHSMTVRVFSAIEHIDPREWNALDPGGNPFVRHEFLSALETTGCVGPSTGWLPHHTAVFQDNRLVAAAPVYLKMHSYGEYVFDWAWARAYERAGLSYFPKLVIAVPFSPVSGPRLLIHPDAKTSQDILEKLLSAIARLAQSMRASSTHWLFVTPDDAKRLNTHAPFERTDCQFHWTNHSYRDFDHFLEALSHKKRKNIRQERRNVLARGVRLSITPAAQTTPQCWHEFHLLYERTCHLKGGVAYLNALFFSTLAARMPDQLLLVRAHLHGELVAAAFCLRNANTLYGRNWGSRVEIPGLHFETCYYAPMEYCIKHGIERFEAGAQGEQKLSRGFMPAATISRHWIAEPAFRDAILHFVRNETQTVHEWMEELSSHTPYHDRDRTDRPITEVGKTSHALRD